MIRLRSAFLSVTLLVAGCSGIDGSISDPVRAGGWYTHGAAMALYHKGQYQQAQDMCKAAIASIEKSKGASAPELASPLVDLATFYLRLDRFAEAKAAIERAQPLIDPAKKDQAELYARFCVNKAWRLETFGETAAATSIFESAQAALDKAGVGDSIDKAEVINDLALVYEDTAHDSEDDELLHRARTLLYKAWEMRRRVTGNDSPESVESLSNLGTFLLLNAENLEDTDAAVESDLQVGLQTLRKALEASIRVYGEEHAETAMAHSNLAMGLMLHREFNQAEKELRIAIPITLHTLGPVCGDRADEISMLGQIQEHLLEDSAAEKSFIEAVTIDEHIYGPNDPHVASELSYLANLYDKTGDTARAQQVKQRIDRINGRGT